MHKNYHTRAEYWIHKNGRLLTVGERKERKAASDKRYRDRNKEKIRSYNHRQYLRLKEIDTDRLRAYARKSYARNKEKRLAHVRKYRQENKEAIRTKKHLYYLKKKSAQTLPKCIGCEILLKSNEQMVCQWCLSRYPHKYIQING